MLSLSWFPESVRDIAEKTLCGEHIKDVPEVIANLQQHSDSLIRKKLGKEFFDRYYPSNRKGGKWKAGNPVGIVDHYTSAPSVEGTLRWFSNHPRDTNSDSSAHVIIDRTGDVYVIVDPLSNVAWHARQANATHVGIEHVNTGWLVKKAGKYYFMGYLPYPKDKYGLVGLDDHGDTWECYSVPQVLSNVILKRWLIDWAPTITREHLTDHSAIDPVRKLDCGPLWPLAKINDLVVSWKDLSKFQWIDSQLVTPTVFKMILDDF